MSALHSFSLVLVAGAVALFSTLVIAQQPRSLKIPAPPPMKFIPREERSKLSEARDPKIRIRTAIDLAADHLSRAEELTSQKRFDRASEELGNYLALLDDMRQFLHSMNSDKRLEVIRRSTPVDYAENVKAAAEYARNARSEALEAFYGHTVLREEGNKTKNPPPESKLP
ncbi:MAG: hypothetical protein DMF71_15195 [Acidobacteria bacterium]|nr:MAG: hypothetical protein DMF71_15195 [Acidobacteriota bacterium]